MIKPDRIYAFFRRQQKKMRLIFYTFSLKRYGYCKAFTLLFPLIHWLEICYLVVIVFEREIVTHTVQQQQHSCSSGSWAKKKCGNGFLYAQQRVRLCQWIGTGMMEGNVYKNVIIFGRWHFFYCVSTNFRINCSTKYTAQARQFTTSYPIHPNADKTTANFELFFFKWYVSCCHTNWFFSCFMLFSILWLFSAAFCCCDMIFCHASISLNLISSIKWNCDNGFNNRVD